MTKLETNHNILKKRPYQNEALFSIANFVKDLLRWILEKDLNKVFQNAALLNMATWSGKTFTIWTALNNIIKLRNRFNWIKNKEEFQKLNIVVLTHRIDLVNQFRDDLVYGRDNKAPILTDDVLDLLHISTYHSKADKEDIILDNEEYDLWEWENKDNIIFSTYQTAWLERIVDKLDYIDIILIDESHNVKMESEYRNVIKELSLKTRNWTEALILPITATPNDGTRKLFGQEVFDYWLEKYLNSKYSPSVEYNLVTNSNADIKLIEKLSAIVEESKHTDNIKAKKELVREAEELFSEIMSSFVDNEALVDDLFERVWENWELEETVIFCDSIKSADVLAKIMNEKKWLDWFALAFHSQNDSNDGISKLRDKNDPCKVILSIWKLNEWIDLPKVKNVVFWRGTDSETIFFQQFGRGLRWDELVRYFDYVWGIKNFAWINEILVKYEKEFDEINKKDWSWDESIKKKFSLLGWTTSVNKSNINLFDIWFDILQIKNEDNISKQDIIDYFKNIKESVDESYNYLINFSNKKIADFKFKWYKLAALLKITEFKLLKNDLVTSNGWYKEFICMIFNKEYIQEVKEQISKNEVIDFLKNYKWQTEEDSYSDLMSFKGKDISDLEYKWHKVVALLTVSWFKFSINKYINTPSWFQEFISFIFNKEYKKEVVIKEIIEDVSKDEIITFFKNYDWRTEDESYEYLINLLGKVSSKIKYKWNSVWEMSKQVWWTNPNKIRIYRGNWFKEFINWLFNKDDNIVWKDEVVNYLKSIKKTKEDSYEYFINFSKKDIASFEYKWFKIKKIVTMTWWEKFNIVDVYKIEFYREWVNWFFWKEWEKNNKEDIKKYFKTIKKTEEESYLYLFNMNNKDIRDIDYLWNKITKLVRLSWWNKPKWVNVETLKWFKKWLSWLFDKEVEKKDDYVKLSKNEIENYFTTIKETKDESYEYWLKLKATEITSIKVRWNKIVNLVKLSLWDELKDNIVQSPNWFHKWINWLFDKKEIDKKELFEYFSALKKDNIKSYEYLINFNQKDIWNLEYKWSKIINIVKLSWWENPNNFKKGNLSWFNEWCSWLFNKEK